MLKSTICGTTGSFTGALGHRLTRPIDALLKKIQFRYVYCSSFATMNLTINEIYNVRHRELARERKKNID